MSMIKWQPFEELEKALGNAEQGLDLAIDLYEEDGNVVAKMNVPGIDGKDIKVDIKDGQLHVSGKREEKKEIEKKDYYHKEIRYGSFERLVTLPCPVDANAMTYNEADGILTVTMPKK